MILIKNGLLFDGDQHKRATIKNILIADGKVKQISSQEIIPPEKTTVIDATGKWITPGFIDTHTHYDAEIIASPGIKESARHGVTSILVGSCSVSAIYNSPLDTSDSFTRVEAIPREVMLPLLEKEKSWNTSQGWIDFIEKKPLGVNVASFVGHSDLRSKVMGLKRSVTPGEKATKAEIKEMDSLLEKALDEGFLGMSSMDNPWDKMDGDRYWSHKTPSFYGSWGERKSQLDILRRRGAIYQGAPNLVTRVSAIRYMMASSGLLRKPLKTTMIAMMDLIGDRYLLPVISGGAKSFNTLLNADFRMQTPPCPFTVYYDGWDSIMFEEFPSGEAIRHLAKDLDGRRKMMGDKAFRENFKKEFKNKYAPKVWHKDLSIAYVIDCPEKKLIGKNFIQIAEEQKTHPVEAFLDLLIKYDRDIRWKTTIANDRVEEYEFLYNYPYTLMSFSDAGAHLTNMAFYNFPLKMIKYVQDSIDKGKPFMSMEKCIWRLSGEQGDWFMLNKGYIKEGADADINILDPQHFKNIHEQDIENAPIEEFNGFNRLVNRNNNVVSHVLVNGEIIWQNQKFADWYGKTKKVGKFLKAKFDK